MLNGIQTLWGREPAMVVSLVGAVIALGVSFGLSLTDQQVGAIMALTAIVIGLVTRTQVTPTSALPPVSIPPASPTPVPQGSEPS